MPLGNYTSQFFANVYLNDLDQYVKHKLKIKYYIRYVDDFVILHTSEKQLEEWKGKIETFLRDGLKLKLHPNKSRTITLSRGVDFVGFRNFKKHRLLRKRNYRSMLRKIGLYKKGALDFNSIYESYQGWQAYAIWADTHKLREKAKQSIIDILWNKI